MQQSRWKFMIYWFVVATDKATVFHKVLISNKIELKFTLQNIALEWVSLPPSRPKILKLSKTGKCPKIWKNVLKVLKFSLK